MKTFSGHSAISFGMSSAIMATAFIIRAYINRQHRDTKVDREKGSMFAVPQAPLGKFPDEPGSAYTTKLQHIADESTHEYRKLGFATRYFGLDKQDMARRVRGDPVSQLAATASQNLQGGLNDPKRAGHYESPLLSLRLEVLRDTYDDDGPTKDASAQTK